MTLRVVVVGAGWAGEIHLVGYGRATDAEVVAICSRTRSRAEELADRHDVRSVYTDLEKALAVEEPDVVSIATPPAVHREMTLAALEHGCHVLCDKPVALTGDDAEELYRAAEGRAKRHASGFIWRNDPGILRLRELLAEGAIGDIRELHSRSALGAPVLPMTWFYQEEEGGGALMQHGGHVIDRARWVLGQEFAAVSGQLLHDVKEAVVGPRFHNLLDAFAWAGKRAVMGGEELPTAPVTADTGYAFQAEFDSGIRGVFWEGIHAYGFPPESVEVYGEKGTLSWSGAAGLTLFRPRTAPEHVATPGSTEAGSGDMRALEAVAHGLWGELCQSFVDDILGRPHRPYGTLYDGWKVQAVIDAVRRSAESRRWESC